MAAADAGGGPPRYKKKERVQLSEEQRKQLELKRKQQASKLSWNEGADDGRGLRIVVLKHVSASHAGAGVGEGPHPIFFSFTVKGVCFAHTHLLEKRLPTRERWACGHAMEVV
eukprot:COSAG01_NODE_1349_length_10618_cov_12.745318_4_plen_113_part_00